MKIFVSSGIIIACLLSTTFAEPEYETGRQSRIRLNLGLMVPPIQVKLPRLELPQLIIGANIVRKPNAKPLTISMPPLPQISFGGEKYSGNENSYEKGDYDNGIGNMNQQSSQIQIRKVKAEVKKIEPTKIPDVIRFTEQLFNNNNNNQHKNFKLSPQKDAQQQALHEQIPRPMIQPDSNFLPLEPLGQNSNYLAQQDSFYPQNSPPLVSYSYNPNPINTPIEHHHQQQHHPIVQQYQTHEISPQSFFYPINQNERPNIMSMKNQNHPTPIPQIQLSGEVMSFIAPPNSGYEVMPNFIPKRQIPQQQQQPQQLQQQQQQQQQVQALNNVSSNQRIKDSPL